LIRGVDILNPGDAWDDPNAVDMNGVKLSISPLLRLALSNFVLLQERHEFGLQLEFFSVQAFPNPHSIEHWVTVCAPVSSANALAVVKVLVGIVMAFRARLQCRVHGLEVLTSMLSVTSYAGDASVAMCGNNSSSEAFGLMTGGAVGVHLVLVGHAYSQSVTRSARTAGRLFGNRRGQDKAAGCMRS